MAKWSSRGEGAEGGRVCGWGHLPDKERGLWSKYCPPSPHKIL